MCKKHIAGVVIIMVLLSVKVSQGGVYTFIKNTTSPTGNAGWFDAGEFSPVQNGVSIIRHTGVAGYLRAYPAAGTDGNVGDLGEWAGANWSAPENEVISKITFTAYWSGAGNPGTGDGYSVSVWAGVDAPDETMLLRESTTVGTWRTLEDSVINITDPLTTGYTELQLRAWENAIAARAQDDAQYGQFEDVTIETMTIPEPVTLGLMGLGSVLLLRRRQK
jgi:hypothetical protein